MIMIIKEIKWFSFPLHLIKVFESPAALQDIIKIIVLKHYLISKLYFIKARYLFETWNIEFFICSLVI